MATKTKYPTVVALDGEWSGSSGDGKIRAWMLYPTYFSPHDTHLSHRGPWIFYGRDEDVGGGNTAYHDSELRK